MKKNNLNTLVYSTGGVLALFAILVAFNFLAATGKQRIDLTAEKAFTLSPGTRAILKQVDTPIKIRFYFSQSKMEMPVVLKTHAQRVMDLLDEYREASKGKIEIEKLDPEPDSDAETSAGLDGVQGEATTDGEKIYLGLAISMLGQTVPIAFLSPEREKLLEYDISRAISRVIRPERPVIGIMSPLPIFGQQMNPFLQRMGQRGEQPWILVDELKQDFTVKQVDIGADKIDDEIKVLVVIHPRDITDSAQFAIDQFVMRGGKLLAFVDPSPYFDKSAQNQGNPMGGGAAGSSLDKLFSAWGVSMDTGKVVADPAYGTRVQQNQGPNASILSLTPEAISSDAVVTGDIDNILMIYAGSFSGTPAAGLKESVLLKASKQSGTVDRMMAQFAGAQLGSEFKPDNTERALAIELTGKFKTAFPDGKPASKDDEKLDAADKEKKAEKKAADKGAYLKESATDKGAVILVADSDMLYDMACASVQEIFGQRIMSPLNGNLAFTQNAIEELSGNENLIAVRSRATMHRPFTRVRKMQAAAEAAYQDKIKQLQDSLSETQSKLSELQRNKQPGQRFILSPEQQAEVDNYKKQESKAKADLKEVRKNLRHEIVSLEVRLKWINIAAMPLMVALSGIVLAVIKRKRTAAK